MVCHLILFLIHFFIHLAITLYKNSIAFGLKSTNFNKKCLPPGLYAYAGYSTTAGDIARLLSPTFPSQTTTLDSCVSFYYRLYGPDVKTGSLQVFVRPSGSQGVQTPLWEMTGSRGNEWHRARVQVPNSQMKQPFEVRCYT